MEIGLLEIAYFALFIGTAALGIVLVLLVEMARMSVDLGRLVIQPGEKTEKKARESKVVEAWKEELLMLERKHGETTQIPRAVALRNRIARVT